MSDLKIPCIKCGAKILPMTADANEGACRRCTPKGKKVALENVVEGIDTGLRLTFGVIFAIVFAIAAYSLGAVIWSGIGLMLAMPALFIGFVYGLFLPEINGLIRGFFNSLVD